MTLPWTGELVDLGDPPQVARALVELGRLQDHLDDVKRILDDTLRAESERQGTKTLHFDGVDAVISGGTKVTYDELDLMRQLRRLGLPESRIADLVVETVSYRVDQRVAKQVAASNPRYADAIAACRRVHPAPWYVRIKTKGGTA